jgi:zinc protease
MNPRISILMGLIMMVYIYAFNGYALERIQTMIYETPQGVKIHKETLENGLTVVVVPNDFAPVFTYRTYFKVGSVDEESGKRGIAHLFEHMMFRETKNLKNGEFDKRVTQMGGTHLNAYTSTDRTVYLQSLPSSFLEDMAKLESDRMVNLIVNKEKLEVERGAVLSEYYMYLNNPGAFFFKSLNEIMYQKHPYQYDVIGTEAEIKSFTVEECLKFYKQFYSPANATIIVVGNVKPDQVSSVVKKHYGHLKPLPVKRAPLQAEPQNTAQVSKEIKHPYASQVEMGMGVKLLDLSEADLPYFFVLQQLLGENEFGLAHSKIIKKGLGTSINSYFDLNPKGMPDAYYFMVTLAPNVPTRKLRLVTHDIFEQLKSRPISKEKIQMAVNQVKLHYFVNSNEDLADMVIDGLNYNGDPSFAFRFLYETFIKTKFNPKKLLEIVRTYFLPERMNFLFLSPGPNEELAAQQPQPGQT